MRITDPSNNASLCDQLADESRKSVYDPDSKKFLLANISASDQITDLSTPANCDGFGRVRHFKRFISDDWCLDPLPIDPALRCLGHMPADKINAQVLQIASCNLNCWYCFVPDALKCADPNVSDWFSADEIVQIISRDSEKDVTVIDLSGGNPELVPEWVVDMMESLEKYDLKNRYYLWSDDTLTTDFTFRYLTKDQLKYMSGYKNYGRVCCFKGFDEHSFEYNSRMPGSIYKKQFDNFSRLLDLGLDLYGYVTFTTDDLSDVGEKMSRFVDKLKKIHELLPLRVVPLKIYPFTPTRARLTESYLSSMNNQVNALVAWEDTLRRNYTVDMLRKNISEISMR